MVTAPGSDAAAVATTHEPTDPPVHPHITYAINVTHLTRSTIQTVESCSANRHVTTGLQIAARRELPAGVVRQWHPDPDLSQLGLDLRIFEEDDDPIDDRAAARWDWDSRRLARLRRAWERGRWRGDAAAGCISRSSQQAAVRWRSTGATAMAPDHLLAHPAHAGYYFDWSTHSPSPDPKSKPHTPIPMAPALLNERLSSKIFPSSDAVNVKPPRCSSALEGCR